MKQTTSILLLLFQCVTGWMQEPVDVSKFIAEGFEHEEFFYPERAAHSKNFALLEPGALLVPYKNGIYMPDFDTWLWRVDSLLVQAVYPCLENETTYFIATDVAQSHLMTFRKLGERSVFKKLASFQRGVFDLRCADRFHIYLWGADADSTRLYKYDGFDVKLLFSIPYFIHDISFFSPTELLLATGDGGVFWAGENEPPRPILKLDAAVDGIEIVSDGSVFLSTELGIFRFYDLEDLEDFDPIAYYIHGPLTIHNDHLYVRWMENSQIVKIKL